MEVPGTPASRLADERRPAASGRPAARRLWLGGLAVLVAGAALGLALLWKGEVARRGSARHAARGLELRRSGDLTGALAELDKSVRLDPRNAQAWYLLGRARDEAMPGSGLEALARAVRLQPENEVALRDYGVDLHEAGRIDQARPLLERAVELDPTDQEAHAALGRAYASRTTGPEDLKRAVEAFRTALQLQPGDVQTRFRLARLWYQSDDLEKARGEFETTLSLLAEGGRRTLDPMDGRTVQSVTWISLVKGCHHHLAQIAARQKRAAEAARHRRLFDAMEQYVHQTYYLFNDLKARPDDPVARRRLSELFVRFGFPTLGPDGPAAVARWIGG